MKKKIAIGFLPVFILAMMLIFNYSTYSQNNGDDLPEEYKAATVPEKLSDKEIDDIINNIGNADIGNVQSAYDDDPADIDQGPALSDENEQVYNTIIANPSDPEYVWMTDDWMYGNPVVVYYLIRNYYWINDHPDIGIWLYSRPLFIWSDPYVAFAAYGNYIFLNRYPRCTIPLYMNVGWLHRHPYVAERVFVNEKFLGVYPRVARHLYKDEGWFLSHPHVARIAYKNKSILKNHPAIAKGAFRYGNFMMSHPGYQHEYKYRDKSGVQHMNKSPHYPSGSFGEKHRNFEKTHMPDGDGLKEGKTHTDHGPGFKREHKEGGSGKQGGGKGRH